MTIRADRLLKLADYLETVPRGQFVMAQFGNGPYAKECGFSGCAIGWATHAKLFRGLRFTSDTDGAGNPLVQYRNNESTWGGLGQLFGVDGEVLKSDLFGYRLTGTPKQVSKRIRKFVRDYKDTSHAD